MSRSSRWVFLLAALLAVFGGLLGPTAQAVQPTGIVSAPIAAITVLPVGDSTTQGVGGLTAYPGYRGMLLALLRAQGMPVTAVGPYIDGPANAADMALGRYAPGIPRHAGHSGDTQAQIASRIPAQIAALASPPTVLIDISGTNDAGSSGATMLASKSSLLTAYRTAAPRAWILVCTIPPVTASGSSQTNRAAFNAGLAALVAARGDPRMRVVDLAAVLGADSQSVVASAMDSHPQPRGYGIIARTLADAIFAIYPPGSYTPSRPVPRTFMPRGVQSAITLPGALDGVQVVDATNLTPSDSSAWWIALDFQPTTIGSSLHGVVSFGSAYYPNGAALFTQGTNNALYLYVSGGGGVNVIAAGVLVVNTWIRIFTGCSADTYCWIFVNGAMGGSPAFGSTWAWVGNTLQVGASSGFGTALGLYGRVGFGYGASAPQTIDAAGVSAERDYWDGATAGGLRAFYRADEGSGSSVADRNFVAGAMTLGNLSTNTINATITGGGGGAAFATPATYPAWW